MSSNLLWFSNSNTLLGKKSHKYLMETKLFIIYSQNPVIIGTLIGVL